MAKPYNKARQKVLCLILPIDTRRATTPTKSESFCILISKPGKTSYCMIFKIWLEQVRLWPASFCVSLVIYHPSAIDLPPPCLTGFVAATPSTPHEELFY